MDNTFLKNELGEEYHILSHFYYNRQIREKFQRTNEAPELQGSFLNRVKEMYAYVFKDKIKEFEELITDLKSRNFVDNEKMLTSVINEVFAFAKKNFTREELEKLQQTESIKQEDGISLNDFSYYNIDSKDASILEIHMQANSRKGAEAIRESFAILAGKLQNDSTLENIKTILAFSWIVFEHPRIFERLGFTVINISEEDKVLLGRQRAEISREEFIKRYGQK